MMNSKLGRLNNLRQKGFSLVELLIVIAIIGILSAVVTSALSSARTKARVAKAQLEVRSIENAIKQLEIDTGQWPGHKSIGAIEPSVSDNEMWDLGADEAGLVTTDGSFFGWRGPYITEMPLDPWGQPYFFDTDYDIDDTAGVQNASVIGSFGPNMAGQNVYDSDNVIKILAQ